MLPTVKRCAMFTKTFSEALEDSKAYVSGWEKSIKGISIRIVGLNRNFSLCE